MKRSRPSDDLTAMVSDDDNSTIECAGGKFSQPTRKKTKNPLHQSADIYTQEWPTSTFFVRNPADRPLVFSDAWDNFFAPRRVTRGRSEVDSRDERDTQIYQIQRHVHSLELFGASQTDQYSEYFVEGSNVFKMGEEANSSCWEFDPSFVETSQVDIVPIQKLRPRHIHKNSKRLSMKNLNFLESEASKRKSVVISPEFKPSEGSTASLPAFEL